MSKFVEVPTSGMKSKVGENGYYDFPASFRAAEGIDDLPLSTFIVKSMKNDMFTELMKKASLNMNSENLNKIAVPDLGVINTLHVCGLSFTQGLMIVNLINRDAIGNIVLSADYIDCGKLVVPAEYAQNMADYRPGAAWTVTLELNHEVQVVGEGQEPDKEPLDPSEVSGDLDPPSADSRIPSEDRASSKIDE